MSPQPPTSPGTGGPRSALRDQAEVCSRTEFCARLNTDQIEGELRQLFIDFPEFGRSLFERLSPYLDNPHDGNLTFIAAGGEVSVFFDASRQQVIKLCGLPSKCHFGWIIHRGTTDQLELKPGSLDQVLNRLALFESLFPTGLSIDAIAEDDSFLLFRQPFIVGNHPTKTDLENWMTARGWKKLHCQSPTQTIRDLSWQKNQFIASDVRPENAILAESDQQIYPIDFIVAGKEIQ